MKKEDLLWLLDRNTANPGRVQRNLPTYYILQYGVTKCIDSGPIVSDVSKLKNKKLYNPRFTLLRNTPIKLSVKNLSVKVALLIFSVRTKQNIQLPSFNYDPHKHSVNGLLVWSLLSGDPLDKKKLLLSTISVD